eukprot:4615347-Amphidinium_carterae.2
MFPHHNPKSFKSTSAICSFRWYTEATSQRGKPPAHNPAMYPSTSMQSCYASSPQLYATLLVGSGIEPRRIAKWGPKCEKNQHRRLRPNSALIRFFTTLLEQTQSHNYSSIPMQPWNDFSNRSMFTAVPLHQPASVPTHARMPLSP